MNLESAQSELRIPPKIGLQSMLLETVVVVAVAYLMVALFA